jgi:hypothetical protein
METAVSKTMKGQLEELFERVSHSVGHKAKIHINSIITDDQETKYN